MSTLSTADVVWVWERGLRQDSVERALTMLAAACPGESREDLASLSIGRRDARLLAIHRSLFGPAFRCYAECPRCGAQLEFTLDARDFGTHQSGASGRLLEVNCGETDVRCRAPNSHDLGALADAGDAAVAARVLSERCVVEARHAGNAIAPSDLPDAIMERVAAAIAAAEPQTDTVLALQCHDCTHAWELLMDVAAFLWIEVTALAKQLLQQTHLLAWAYGWREADILGMSDARRRAYLDMVG